VRRFEIVLNEKAYWVEVTGISNNGALVTVNGTQYDVGFKEIAGTPEMLKVSAPLPQTVSAEATHDRPQLASVVSAGGMTTINAPLPGLILSIRVKVGDRVKPGDVLLVIETMKMENNITSPRAGVIKEIKVSPKDNVNEGTPLIVIGD
jgi:biotin carboxyl carrier protein